MIRLTGLSLTIILQSINMGGWVGKQVRPLHGNNKSEALTIT